MMRKRLFSAIGLVLFATQLLAYQPPAGQTPAGQAPPGQGEFLPIDQLPPSEQLPAAPLLITAYAFVWIAVFFYIWTVWRRLNKVEAEMRVFEKRQQRSHPR
jgi:CcmD family protein